MEDSKKPSIIHSEIARMIVNGMNGWAYLPFPEMEDKIAGMWPDIGYNIQQAINDFRETVEYADSLNRDLSPNFVLQNIEYIQRELNSIKWQRNPQKVDLSRIPEGFKLKNYGDLQVGDLFYNGRYATAEWLNPGGVFPRSMSDDTTYVTPV